MRRRTPRKSTVSRYDDLAQAPADCEAHAHADKQADSDGQADADADQHTACYTDGSFLEAAGCSARSPFVPRTAAERQAAALRGRIVRRRR
jgi:hypothetical protein